MFWHAVLPSNSLVVTWENSPVNRDVNTITNFQAELFADGSFEYRYDDHTVGYVRVHPLDLDFDGLPNAIDPAPETPLSAPAWNQSDAWAAVAFPDNAAEIAAAGGYAVWAAQRASDPNRRLVSLGVASLTLGGRLQRKGKTTWGAIGSGAEHETPMITGGGILRVKGPSNGFMLIVR